MAKACIVYCIGAMVNPMSLVYLHLLKTIERVSRHPLHTMSTVHNYAVINISDTAAIGYLHISGKAIRLSIRCVLTYIYYRSKHCRAECSNTSL